MKLKCQHLTHDGVFDTLESAWDELHQRSTTATFFNSVTYARLWWRHFGLPETLQVWTVWEEERLLGVAPLYETTDEQGMKLLRFVGGVEVSDYLDVVTEPGREEEVLATLLAAWADAPCCSVLDFHALPHASPSREVFLRLAPSFGFTVEQEREEVCPVITLPQTWEAYLAMLEGKQRREIRRKLRKAGQEGLVSWYRTPPELASEEIELFFQLHIQSTADKAAFMTPTMQAFFRDLVMIFSQQGILDLSFLLINGVPAATLLAFHFRKQLLLYNSGFNDQISEALSPGWLLLGYHIENAIASQTTRYDFMQGDEVYKYRLGGQTEPVYQVRLIK